MDVIAEILTEQGPMTDEQLLAQLRARGGDLAQTSITTLEDTLDEDDARVMPLVDERWAWLPSLLAGRVFTHRVSGREVEHDLLDLSPDLDPLAMLTESRLLHGLQGDRRTGTLARVGHRGKETRALAARPRRGGLGRHRPPRPTGNHRGP